MRRGEVSFRGAQWGGWLWSVDEDGALTRVGAERAAGCARCRSRNGGVRRANDKERTKKRALRPWHGRGARVGAQKCGLCGAQKCGLCGARGGKHHCMSLALLMVTSTIFVGSSSRLRRSVASTTAPAR